VTAIEASLLAERLERGLSVTNVRGDRHSYDDREKVLAEAATADLERVKSAPATAAVVVAAVADSD
jgi:hypothetical protein